MVYIETCRNTNLKTRSVLYVYKPCVDTYILLYITIYLSVCMYHSVSTSEVARTLSKAFQNNQIGQPMLTQLTPFFVNLGIPRWMRLDSSPIGFASPQHEVEALWPLPCATRRNRHYSLCSMPWGGGLVKQLISWCLGGVLCVLSYLFIYLLIWYP